jgi:hypothetical protein
MNAPKYYVMALRPGIAFASADLTLQAMGLKRHHRRQLLQQAHRSRSECIVFEDATGKLFAAVRQGTIWRQGIGHLPMFDTFEEAEDVAAEVAAELGDEPHELAVMEYTSPYAGGTLQ